MKTYEIYSVGSALVDLQFTVPYSLLEAFAMKKGGSGANTLVTLHHLGGKGFYSCHAADDVEGTSYHPDLQHDNIESNLDFQSKAKSVTGGAIFSLRQMPITHYSHYWVPVKRFPVTTCMHLRCSFYCIAGR
jgi:sugar/nucleoside kinase (ribokinase family)